jgi:signal transduction histidine kinase
MISHEFRSPLTTIQSSVEILELYSDKLISQDRSEHFKKIYNSINYLANLLDDVITLSHAEARKINPNFEKLEIVDYSSRIIEQLKNNFQNAVSVNFNPTIAEFNVLIDKKLYTQILSNLLSNAIKYTPEGKKVEIKISRLKEKFILEVCDNGIGIPKESQDKIFTPFIRASNAGNISGTGLGLAIVQQSVNILNGKISFKSEVNKGSIFKVVIPINNQSK